MSAPITAIVTTAVLSVTPAAEDAPGDGSGDSDGSSSGSYLGSYTGSFIGASGAGIVTSPASVPSDDAELAREFATQEAQQLLDRAGERLASAEAELADATARAERAQEDEIRAERELSVAREVARRSRHQIDDLEDETYERRKRLSAIAQAAYANGNRSTLTQLMQAEHPSQLVDLLSGVRTLARIHDAELGRVAATTADLNHAQIKLRHDVDVKDERKEAATRASAGAGEAKREADAARARLADEQAEYERARALAKDEKFDAYQDHLELLGESSELDDYLDSLDDGSAGFGTGTFGRPGTGGVTSPFGQRFHPILRYTKLHTGTDFSVGDGVVYAADSGVVVTAGWLNAYGNTVIIDHGTIDGRRVTTLYAHQSDLRVRTGQRVARGQQIGRIGSTGYSTGPHLHFEVRLDGAPSDPSPWLP